jgi:hypothetical protein
MKVAQRIAGCASAVLVLASAFPASATAPVAPRAGVQVLDNGTATLNWHGRGDLIVTRQLCISSTSGRYQLRVISTDTGTPGRAPRYTVSFQSDAGDHGEGASSNGSVFLFDGRTTEATSCTGRPNATLEIRYEQSDLTAAIAGQYPASFQLSVLPN